MPVLSGRAGPGLGAGVPSAGASRSCVGAGEPGAGSGLGRCRLRRCGLGRSGERRLGVGGRPGRGGPRERRRTRWRARWSRRSGRGPGGPGRGGRDPDAVARARKRKRMNMLIAGFAVFIMLAGIGVVGFTYYSTNVVLPKEIPLPLSTTVYIERRQDHGGQARQREPHLRHHRQHPAARAGRGRRRRGPQLLPALGRGLQGHRPGRLEQPLRWRQAGCLDHHPAVRPQRLREPPGRQLHAEGEGGDLRLQAERQVHQEADHGELPQRDLLRSGRVRHRGGGADVLQDKHAKKLTRRRARCSPR